MLDPRREPFSRAGSWLSIAWEGEERPSRTCGDGWYLRCHHARGVIQREVCRLEFLKEGQPVPVEVVMQPWSLTATAAGGAWLAIAFAADGGLAIAGSGLGLRLRTPRVPGVIAYRENADTVVLNARKATRRYAIERLAGSLELVSAWRNERNAGELHPGMRVEASEIVIDALPVDGRLELAIDEFWSTWHRGERLGQAATAAGAEAAFTAFLTAFGRAPADDLLATGWRRAAYILWASTVAPAGLLRRPAIFMSKHHMDQVWSWDHCFNAQALAAADPDLAWDQWHLPFDLQDDDGALPDGFNDVFRHYNFCKPPVHGWTALELLRRSRRPLSARACKEISRLLERQAGWFLTYRRAAGQDLPHYLHGNDSGWDNGTMFDDGVPLQGPDLTALLILQCEAIARTNDLAGGSQTRSDRWKGQARELLQALLTQQWDGHRFVPQRLVDGRRVPVACDSLIPCMPLILGRRLPKTVQTGLAAALERLTTTHGLATEHPTSPHYTPDGYWRGPIWAPSTHLAVCGLEAIGRQDLAATIASRFITTCARSGCAENFDALTGAGLRDPAYTWTASVALMLTARYAIPSRSRAPQRPTPQSRPATSRRS